MLAYSQNITGIMMKWNVFGFFPEIDPIHEAAQQVEPKALLNILKSLYSNGHLKIRINNFYEHEQVVLIPPLCLVLNQKSKNLTSLRYLLSFGANPNLNERFVMSGNRGNAPIHQAARKDNLEAIAMLTLAGANIYQTGSGGIDLQTLLERRGYSKRELSFLTRLNSIQKELEEGKEAIENSRIAQQDRIEKTVAAYETLILKWQAYKYEEFFSQFNDENKKCLVAFIEDKITLLKYDLYEFIMGQFYDPASLSDELTDKIQNLISNILEYNRIDELPIPREKLAAHLADLIIKSEALPSKKENSLYENSSVADNFTQTFYLRKRNIPSKLDPHKNLASPENTVENFVTINTLG